MVSAHYCSHQFWNLCFCYILKELYFSPVFDREGDDLNFRSVTQSHLCFSIWKHIAPFSLSLEFDQINGHCRSVADLSIKKPFEACPKKEIQNCCGASSMCTVLAWRHYFLHFWIWTPMVSLWRWWSHTGIFTAPTKLKWPLAGQSFPVTKTLFSPF